MKKLLLILIVITVGIASCWQQQWEERVADGDTGSVTHGDPQPDTGQYYYGNCAPNSITHNTAGRALFDRNCASCHYTTDKVMVGPGLFGVRRRIPNTDWLYKFVQNEKALYQAGDAYTVRLRKEFPLGDYYHHFSFNNKMIEDALGKH